MDRGKGRTGIEPRVRQVGFVTPGSEPLTKAASVSSTVPGPTGLVLEGLSSPLPVIVPPGRAVDIPMKTVSMSVPSRSPRRLPVPDSAIGSYNPADSILGSSTTPTSSKGESTATFDVLESLISGSGTVTAGGKGGVANHEISANTAGSTPPYAILDVPMESSKDQPGFHENQLTSKDQTSKAERRAVQEAHRAAKAVAKEPGLDENSKTLKERTSKAERRAVQEAQRAAKAAAKESGFDKEGGGPMSIQKEAKLAKPSAQKKEIHEKKSLSTGEKKLLEKVQDKEKKKDVPAPRMQFDDEQRVAKAKKRSLVEQTETKNRVELFRHLPQFVHGTQLPSLEAKFFHDDAMHPHPAIYKVGLQYLTGDIVGGNARCVAMLRAFREMIKDYRTPSGKIFVRDMTAKINSHVSFLNNCRPLAISMGNSIKFLKNRIVKLSGELPEADAKESLIAEIDRFIQEKIVFADKEIVRHAVQKIRDGDVLLTHGVSCVVEMILTQAHELGRNFRVVVVDSRPKLEGKRLLKRLLQQGVSCTYTYINGISYIMQEVTRVFLGAASVLSNGTVYSRVGTASVAMVAHAFSVPVMICCETYKFHERVQLDSICANELGNPDALVKVLGRMDLNALEGWADDKHLQLLNLTYDATPADYVSMVITELGMVPPTSVPVILREYRKDLPIRF